MWITNRKITQKNLYKIIYCAKLRDYIENQGFREQKVNTNNPFNITNNRTFRHMWKI